MKYAITAIGVSATGSNLRFVKMTPAMSQEDALAYKLWIEAGPRLKFVVECDLYEHQGVTSVVYVMEYVK